jgi:hypothetical protein
MSTRIDHLFLRTMIDHPKKIGSPAPDNIPKEKKIVYAKK